MGVRSGRWTADLDDDVVVFLIGMHVNRWRDVRAWWPVTRAMPRMLRELAEHPELGLLHASPGWFLGGPSVVQYWRSFEHLEAYARAPESAHLPAWREFNRALRASTAVGVFHETYRIARGSWEAVYVEMPEVGLGAATGVRAVGSTSTAAGRLGAPDAAPAPVAP
jgi:hypothetical protein